MSSPSIQVIIHDNDSAEKIHCWKIRDLQKNFYNLNLIESKPNVGMVRACEKILAQVKGEWIAFLGDDDPILLPAESLLKIIEKNKKHDHLFFRTFLCRQAQPIPMSWFPQLKRKSWNTANLCAKTGFTTHFAFLGAHCFRIKPNLLQKWRDAHERCTFYGHCVMLLENYRKSFFTGIPLAAWNPGNERIPYEMNVRRLLEIKVLLKNPVRPALRQFLNLQPQEIVEKGKQPLKNHLHHPHLEIFNRLEALPGCAKIELSKVENLLFSPDLPVHIGTWEALKKGTYAAAFLLPSTSVSESIPNGVKIALQFACGARARPRDVLTIIAKLRLRGPVFLQGKRISIQDYYLLSTHPAHANPRQSPLKVAAKVSLWGAVILSLFLYGPENFRLDQIILNYLERPRKGIYKILLEAEKTIRKFVQINFPKQRIAT